MRMLDMGTIPTTLIVTLLVAVALLAMRVFVMQRVQTQRQRENRQETERLKSLVAAYRALAGSLLFGSVVQVRLAATCAHALVSGATPDYQPLIDDLRISLRETLGLDPIPVDVLLPHAGPGPVPRGGRGAGEGGREGAAGGRGGGMGGGMGAAAGVGGIGLGGSLDAGRAGGDADG
jgi:preprotein translocase subunit YajC